MMLRGAAERWGLFAAAALALGACTRSAPPARAAPPPVIQASPVVITPTENEPTADEKFARARSLLASGRAAEAAKLFEEIADDPRGSALVPSASFNAGLSWEQAGERERALERFGATLARFPDTEPGKLAAIAAARICGYLEHWNEQSDFADLLLARRDLSPVEELDAVGAKALALVEIGDTAAAKRFVSRGEDLVERLRLGEGGQLPIEVAQLRFALGEIRKQTSESITFVPMPPDFAAVLEQRCQGLLDAQSAFVDAMRSFDPHWATMSGFRVGELYQKLYRDVMAMPPPAAAVDERKRQLFRGAMRLRYRVLLEKGLRMMDHTIMIEKRTGETGPWIERAKQAKLELERALAEEKKELAKLPYTEADLQKALDDLAKRPASP